MLIWVGLGNPSKKHEKQRHNVGFMAVDEIASEYSFGSWREKMNAHIAEGKISGQKIILVKPQTFMNRSGISVSQISKFYKISENSIYVFYDDIDLKSGQIKVKIGGGHAGHNGLRDIDQHIGKEYWRIRIGIGRPHEKALVHKWVLNDFSLEERGSWLDLLLRAIAMEAPILAEQQQDKFISRVAWRAPSPAQMQKQNPQTGDENGI
ncbi:MAG: aminoacyl-tRNA hydrolase [Alphaproteobacteria bacterium]|nr:aminoacyl-tRNA hydrolase [Alphaproteobacteria bacterium]